MSQQLNHIRYISTKQLTSHLMVLELLARAVQCLTYSYSEPKGPAYYNMHMILLKAIDSLFL